MAVVADYSYSRYSGARLRALGITGVTRYACVGRDSINITKAEADDLKANGLGIAITTEHEPDWLMHSPSEVKDRVAGAVQITRAAGLPDGVIALAADWDATLGGPPVSQHALDNMGAILRGLQAAAEVLGPNTGIYSGFYTLQWIAAHSWIGHYWQTIGWSYGQVFPKAGMLQDRVNQTLDGQGIDWNTVLGDWSPRGGIVPPAHATVVPKTTCNVRQIQAAVHAAQDGIWGAETDRNCELVRLSPHCSITALQQYSLGFRGSSVDGIVGQQTVLADLAAIVGIQKGLGVAADGHWGPITQAAYVAASPFR
jgi:hypothetical protein